MSEAPSNEVTRDNGSAIATEAETGASAGPVVRVLFYCSTPGSGIGR